MPSSSSHAGGLRFGIFEVDVRTRELRKNGSRVKLQHQPFELLLILLDRPGDVVTREELRTRLWPADVYVDFDRSLNKAIVKLREALGDSSGCPIYVETLPRIGYRFIGPVNGTTPPAEQAAAAMSQHATEFARNEAATVETGTQGPAPAQAASRVHGTRANILLLACVMAIALLLGLSSSSVSERLFWRQSTPRIQSLAVLPLVNLSNDAEQEYFADGLTEALTTDLGKISALRVISRTSVLQYKGTRKGLPGIARDLNVDALLEGTVLRSGNHVRITANLVQAAPERHLWAESYDTEAGDVLRVQEQIADSVAREIRVTLTPPGSTPSSSVRPVNLEAQDLYFRGIHAKHAANAEAAQNAINYFQQAIQRDPDFARAYAGLAMTYVIWYPQEGSPRENMPKGREAALKALALDDSLSDAHSILGYVELCYDWNWTGAEREFKRALELDPNSALARDYYARELVILGRTDEALAQAQQALALQPYSGGDLPAWVFYLAHRYDKALQIAQQVAAVDPNFAWGHWALAANYEQLGKQTEAAQEYLKFESLSGAGPQRIKRLEEGLAKSGVKGYWQGSLKDYRKATKSRYVPPVLVAGACIRVGDEACAFQWLEKGFEERDDLMIDLNVDPVFEDIRADARFQDLLRRVGIPQ